jgi:hypothetical protein
MKKGGRVPPQRVTGDGAMVTAEMMTGWMDEFVVWVFADLDGMTEDDYVMTRLVSFSVNEV